MPIDRKKMRLVIRYFLRTILNYDKYLCSQAIKITDLNKNFTFAPHCSMFMIFTMDVIFGILACYATHVQQTQLSLN